MEGFQKQFLDLALTSKALLLGDFTLKSGIKSPYFFNIAPCLSNGARLHQLADCYAQAMVHFDLDQAMIFGPAYKGIPLVTALAMAFYQRYERALDFAFNRKEKKDHGEGGSIVGAALSGSVVVVDDVLTKGSAFSQTLALLKHYPDAKVQALLVALDRQEKAASGATVSETLMAEHHIDIFSMVGIDVLITYLKHHGGDKTIIETLDAYRQG